MAQWSNPYIAHPFDSFPLYRKPEPMPAVPGIFSKEDLDELEAEGVIAFFGPTSTGEGEPTAMFEPGDRVTIKETTGTVVENLWGLSSKNMMVEVQFPNGTTSVFAETELCREDEPPIQIALDDLSKVFADSINALSNECHAIAVDHGFWNFGDNESDLFYQMSRVALIHSECSELLEELRKDNRRDAVAEELADICIRVFDFAGGYDLDLGNAILAKMEKNKARPYMHGKKA